MKIKFCFLLTASILLVILLTIKYSTYRSNIGSYHDTKGYRTCRKKSKIGFLKTHKCASSTLQNMLMRYGLKNNLNFVLPSAGNYLGKYRKYSRALLADTPWEQAGLPYNIFCLHTIWNQEEVKETLGEDATYFTMLRDPVSLFESLWVYAGMENYYNMDLETFALSPKTGILSQRAWRNLGRNQMLWDFGLNPLLMEDDSAVDRKITEIENNFHLVMISERMDESIILLKDLLCWNYTDVVNFKLNARKSDNKESISWEAREALKEYLRADYRLYNHFSEKFQDRLTHFGQRRMEQELGILRKANNNMRNKCELQPVDNSFLQGENKLWGPGMMGYKSNSTADPQCRLLALSEMSFIDTIREKQTEKALSILGPEYKLTHPVLDTASLNFQVLNGAPLDIERLKSLLVHN